jgi:hypothetical protein
LKIYRLPEITTTLKTTMYRRSINVSITYNFGNQKVKKVRNIESASDEIKNRTR